MVLLAACMCYQAITELMKVSVTQKTKGKLLFLCLPMGPNGLPSHNPRQLLPLPLVYPLALQSFIFFSYVKNQDTIHEIDYLPMDSQFLWFSPLRLYLLSLCRIGAFCGQSRDDKTKYES